MMESLKEKIVHGQKFTLVIDGTILSLISGSNIREVADIEQCWRHWGAVSKPIEKELKSVVGFDVFWNEYHKITKIRKTDIVPGKKYFRLLPDKEKQLAYDNIKKYYNSIREKKYCKKAYTYLRDKCFLDEFEDTSKPVFR